jgi:hypothetical protein
MLLPRRPPCPPVGLVPISIHLLGMPPAIRQRLPQPHQRWRQAHHRWRPRRFLLRLPPPCRMTLALRWRHRAPRIRLSPSRKCLWVPKFQPGSRSGGVANNCCRPNSGDTVGCTIGGRRGGASGSVPPPTSEGPEVILGRPLRSGVEPGATLTPLPQVLIRAHQAL